jgi:hypothetical protein
MRGLVLVIAALLTGFATSSQATIIHVPADSSTIQGGIDGAADGDTVLVADGHYTGAGNRDIDFHGKGIVVMSGNGPDACFVDVYGTETEPHVGFRFRSGEDSTSVLRGFTIRWGHTLGVGGGVSCEDSSPTIEGNRILGNRAGEPRFEVGAGGGIGCLGASFPIIRNNEIADNSCYGHGGGISCDGASPTIANNVIRNNLASWGGGISCEGSAAPVIVNDILAGNEAGRGRGDGGAIFSDGASPQVLNCTIVENRGEKGGGIYCAESEIVVANTILWGNYTPWDGPELWIGPWNRPSTFTILYSDVAGGEALVHLDGGSVLNWGPGMIDADPRLVSFHGFDFLLKGVSSPCIDAGDPALEDGFDWPGWYPNGPRSDMGAYGGPGNVGWVP